ncbi:helix-turn-helix domain-containing protein [Arcobacteraceae bacterium]|nr:helix-turn-helix domain-containing protein [Arcobacteraceae bacterium]
MLARKSVITQEMIEQVYKLARSGISNNQIIEAIGISKSTFYANLELMDLVKKAKVELRDEVANALLTNANNGDTTSLIFLAKRLNLFSEDCNIKLTDSKSALKSLEQLANADISIEHKNSLKNIISDYLKGYETAVLEERILKLEIHNEE